METKTVQGNKIIAVVYKIENLKNGKIYVGSSSKFEKRKKRHIEDLKSGKHHCKPLQSAVKKYGIDNFVFHVLDKFECYNVRQILEREQYYIDLLKPEYNICKIAGSQLGTKRSEEFRKRCSELTKGKPTWNKGLKTGAQSDSIRLKRSKSMMGKQKSEKERQKIRDKVSKRVLQFNESGQLVKEWDSLKQVSKQFRCSHGRLSEYLNGKSNISTFKGFIWRLKYGKQ